ncbi:MAG: J domain-containing protein [Cyanobacteria bacterium P01_A01_bin.135]
MATNYYQLLQLPLEASQQDIKQAYRRLAKQFHPDSNRTIGDHEHISRLNAAYEVLGDPSKRRQYDVQLRYSVEGQRPPRRNSSTPQTGKPRRPSSGQTTDAQMKTWLKAVYGPVNRCLAAILGSLDSALDQLALDPFDDELMEEFVTYIEACRDDLDNAQRLFRSTPNPSSAAGTASGLYYCLNQVGDALDEFERFTSCYNEHYIHTGQELFRIARQLHRETQASLQNLV